MKKNNEIEKTIVHWRKTHPEYYIILWNKKNIPYNTIIEKGLAVKNYANVSDYCRLKILYGFGGIYLDDDMESIKPFDDRLLSNNAIIGAESKNEFIKILINRIEKNSKWIEGNTYIFGYITVEELKKYGFEKSWSSLNEGEIKIYNDVTIYTGDFFYPHYGSNPLNENTYTKHHYFGRHKR